MRELYDQYECVRVTDMRGVDLSRYRFNTDLTFAALTMHPDGTIYHRYGDRDHRGAGVWLSLPSFEAWLAGSLETHAGYAAAPSPPVLEQPRSVEEIPAFAKKDKGQCIHCHNVLPSLAAEQDAAGTWTGEEIWNYPPPGRIGLDLDGDDQRRVVGVAPGSPAAAAGIAVGDELESLGGQRVLSASDVAAVLHETPYDAERLTLAFARDGGRREVELQLPDGWRRGDPLTYSWRPFKWELRPRPGFGGEDLQAAEKSELGLEEDAFAFLVTYIVTWGENKRFGQAVQRAGIRERDVIVGAGGRDDFAGEPHFQSWIRMSHDFGDVVPIEYLRDGKRRTAELELQK